MSRFHETVLFSLTNIRQTLFVLFLIGVLILLHSFKYSQKLDFGFLYINENISSNFTQNEIKYSINHQYIINNNLAQYSSYLIVDQNQITIEAFVHFNHQYVKFDHFGMKENFTCVLKLLAHGDIKDEMTIQLEAADSPIFYWKENKKLIYNLDLKWLKTDYDEEKDTDLLLKNIVVAIIWKHDYDKTLNLNNVKIMNNSRIVLPYSLIKYQIPSIIYSEIPRLKTVSFCIHFIYKIPSQLKQWIDFHLSFGVREIMIYDGVENRNLTKYLKNIYGDNDRITVVPVDISFDDLCKDSTLFKQLKEIPKELKQYLRKSCKIFYDTEFREKFEWRSQHEQLTVNDCFTVLKQKHEFIGYYDLDEYVFPRTMATFSNYNSTLYSCKSFNSICSINSFQNSFNINKNKKNSNNFYNYLQSLIENNRNGRNVEKLASISFSHAAFLVIDYHEKQLMHDLGIIIDMMEKNNSNFEFPQSIFLSSAPFIKGHTFRIEKNDIDFIKYLYKSYHNLIPCIYKDYLRNIEGLDKNFIRYLYYVTEGNERMAKAIHYYKNVKSLFVHYATDSTQNNWSFSPDSLKGNYLSHFRDDITEIYSRNFSGSIRKLNIDYEFLFLLLKNYTSFCEI